jgi:hypothetical protein
VAEHARHQVAVDGVENQQDIEHEQGEVAPPCVFHHQQRHRPAHRQVMDAPQAQAVDADLVELPHQVVDGVQADAAVDQADDEGQHMAQARVELAPGAGR